MAGSRRKRQTIGRNRSSYELRIAPIRLDPAFPLDWYRFRQPARAITWLHRHDCLELGYCHRGEGVFVVEDKLFPYAAGSVSVIGRHEMHLASSAPDTTSDWTFCSLDPARLLPAADPQVLREERLTGPGFVNLVAADADRGLSALMADLVDELAAARPAWRDAARALVWRILVHLARDHAVRPQPGTRTTLDPLAPALALISQRYREQLTVPHLAAACGMSESHFRRSFTAGVGVGPKTYLDRLRIQVARGLLRDQRRSVLEVALEVGFGSVSAFNRRFRAETGANPRSWRREGEA